MRNGKLTRLCLQRSSAPCCRYEAYVAALAAARRPSFPCVAVVPLREWHGFALGVRRAVTEHVRTPYMMVFPHDLELVRDVDLDALLRVLRDGTNGVR